MISKYTIEAKEGMSSGSRFLLCHKVVVEGHLLHPRHQALVCVHCNEPHTHIQSLSLKVDFVRILDQAEKCKGPMYITPTIDFEFKIFANIDSLTIVNNFNF